MLGAVFIFGQAREWFGLFGRGITISSNVFGSTFFTLTGFHGFHVCVGLIMLSILSASPSRGISRARSRTPSNAYPLLALR